jgi:hypothetical protein
MVGKRYVSFDDLGQLSLAKSARDDGTQKRWYQYKCFMFVGMLQCRIIDGIKWRSVMGDDYFSAIKLIAWVKDVVDSRPISCDAAINRFAHCHQYRVLTKHASPLGQGQVCCVCYTACSILLRFDS